MWYRALAVYMVSNTNYAGARKAGPSDAAPGLCGQQGQSPDCPRRRPGTAPDRPALTCLAVGKDHGPQGIVPIFLAKDSLQS
ncbi:hypothetical protein [Actinoplanes sp. NPDC020271]|uniref:hypothetical protein n=1 Tax=Actinoplanes sp. NPDC020271 TaxID=3363896 RepID=UPI0037A402DB